MLELGIFWIGVVLVVAAIFMLFIDLFQSRKVWAVISLVLVVPLLIHMLLNWSSLNVRKSFYIFIIGLLALLVSISGGALSHLSLLENHEVMQVIEKKIAPPINAPLSNQQQADTASLGVEENYDPLLTGSEFEQLESEEIVPEKINQVVRKAEPIASYQLVADDERIYAINKRVRLIMTDGNVVEGKLTEIVDDSLIVESEVSGGSLGLSYKNESIQSVAVRLMQGEELYQRKELEEVVEKPETDQQQPVVETLPADNTTQVIPEDQPTTGDVNGVIEQKAPVLEMLEPTVQDENETLEKVDAIVDDAKLLENINGH